MKLYKHQKNYYVKQSYHYYSICCPVWDTPCWGVPLPGGNPLLRGGLPTQYPLSHLTGVPPIWTWLGYPPVRPSWGTPPQVKLAGIAPSWTWPGFSPLAGPGWVTPPPQLDLAGVPPPHPRLDGVPP